MSKSSFKVSKSTFRSVEINFHLNMDFASPFLQLGVRILKFKLSTFDYCDTVLHSIVIEFIAQLGVPCLACVRVGIISDHLESFPIRPSMVIDMRLGA